MREDSDYYSDGDTTEPSNAKPEKESGKQTFLVPKASLPQGLKVGDKLTVTVGQIHDKEVAFSCHAPKADEKEEEAEPVEEESEQEEAESEPAAPASEMASMME